MSPCRMPKKDCNKLEQFVGLLASYDQYMRAALLAPQKNLQRSILWQNAALKCLGYWAPKWAWGTKLCLQTVEQPMEGNEEIFYWKVQPLFVLFQVIQRRGDSPGSHVTRRAFLCSTLLEVAAPIRPQLITFPWHCHRAADAAAKLPNVALPHLVFNNTRPLCSNWIHEPLNCFSNSYLCSCISNRNTLVTVRFHWNF